MIRQQDPDVYLVLQAHRGPDTPLPNDERLYIWAYCLIRKSIIYFNLLISAYYVSLMMILGVIVFHKKPRKCWQRSPICPVVMGI